MKKFLQVLSATIVGVGLMAGVAAADTTTTTTTCSSIYETGSDSYNSCVTNSTQTARVTCVNDVYVINNNSQSAGTGGAIVSGNTTGGGAVTGTATNDNGATVNIGASCAPAATTTTTTTPTTPTGGSGAGTPAAAAPVSAQVASLPNTGSDTVLDAAIVGVAVVGGAMAISQIGVSAYRRFTLK